MAKNEMRQKSFSVGLFIWGISDEEFPCKLQQQSQNGCLEDYPREGLNLTISKHHLHKPGCLKESQKAINWASTINAPFVELTGLCG